MLTSVGVGVAVAGLLGSSSSRSRRSRPLAVVVVDMKDTSSRLSGRSGDISAGRGEGSGGGGGSGSRSGRGSVRVSVVGVIVSDVTDTGVTTLSNLGSVDVCHGLAAMTSIGTACDLRAAKYWRASWS
jgi:hypothetical protein